MKGLPPDSFSPDVKIAVALRLPQDISVAEALCTVRDWLGPANRRIFEARLSGHEDSFCWVRFAARHAGLVLIPIVNSVEHHVTQEQQEHRNRASSRSSRRTG